MTLVKVCGLTRSEDVRVAVDLGAWALGFVLTTSPRQVSAEQAARLIVAARTAGGRAERERGGGVKSGGGEDKHRVIEGETRAPHAVLVVTTEPPDWISAALATAAGDGVQLSAGADGPRVAAVREAAARLRRRPLVIAAADTPDAHLADLVLLDARGAGAYGGTGQTLEWERLAADPSVPSHGLVLAGGLRPGNVGEAVRALRPDAVDVSSGVETAPGRKDHGLLRDFFAAVEHADRKATARGASGRPAASTAARRTSG
jgi:phosphoribosylanthranilate isomerase